MHAGAAVVVGAAVVGAAVVGAAEGAAAALVATAVVTAAVLEAAAVDELDESSPPHDTATRPTAATTANQDVRMRDQAIGSDPPGHERADPRRRHHQPGQGLSTEHGKGGDRARLRSLYMNDAADAEVKIERRDALLVVTLDNPRMGNAITRDGAVALADAFDEASLGSDGLRAVLLRSEGKHFCTGANLGGGRSNSSGGGGGGAPATGHLVRMLMSSFHRATASIFNCRLPVVAAVHGTAHGFGVHLALAADFVVAGDGTTFTEPFTERGFNVDSGGSWLLPRLIGLTRAKRMIYLAEPVDAATALSWGLVDQVVPAADVGAVAEALALRLASRSTQALAATKKLLHDGLHTDIVQATYAEAMAVGLTTRSNDFKEGMTAFFEKRTPNFTGT